MTKLEKKILEKVYRLETKKTISQIISQLSGWLIFILLSYFFVSVFLEEVFQFKTWEVLESITDDFELFRNYFFETAYIIYEETPKEILFLAIVSLIIVILFTLTFIKNFGKIRNKLTVLGKY